MVLYYVVLVLSVLSRYNSILDGCTKQRNVGEALRLLEEMKASGIKPSNYTLSILVKLLLGRPVRTIAGPF